MSVVVGIMHGGEMCSLMVKSLIQLMRDRDAQIKGFIFQEGGAGRLDRNRNAVARRFLGTKADWLLTIDTDQYFTTQHFDTLMAAADPQDSPIMCGIIFVNDRPPRANCGMRYEGSIRALDDWQDDTVMQVDYAGSGFMLIHRSVFEKLGDEPYRQDVTTENGELIGEDYAFCHRAREAGFPVKVHTGVFIGHIKPRVLGYDL